MPERITCGHLHGGTVPGVPGWVCGQCWHILPDRPRRYRMVMPTGGGGPRSQPGAARQEIDWMAGELRTVSGMTLGDFVVALAQRFAVKGRMERAAALELALTIMRSLREMGAIGDFADQASEWSRDAAKDIADEEMTYWDDDESGSGGNA